MQILLSVTRWFVRFYKKLNGSADTTFGNGYHTERYGNRTKNRNTGKPGNHFRQSPSGQKSSNK